MLLFTKTSPIGRRGLRTLAMIGATALVGIAAVQAATVSPAAAATALSCDQHTLYGVDGTNKELVAIDTVSHTMSNVVSITPANNALGVARNGVAAYAAINGGNSIVTYDATSGSTTTTANADSAGTKSLIRGAVNPATGIYYMSDGSTPAYLTAYDPNPTNPHDIGQVGTIGNLIANKNGDMAFSSSGVMFVVTGNQIRRVDQTIPTTAGTTALTSTLLTTLPLDPATSGSPGIAFSSDGYLYAVVNAGTGTSAQATVYQIDPSSGAQVNTFTVTSGISITDLGSCNYANTMSSTATVDQRWASGDQFTETITGDQVPANAPGSTGTSDGTGTGSLTQTIPAGPVLTIPARNYTATETAAGTTDLSNYSTTWRCTDQNGTLIKSGSGTTASFAFPQPTTADGVDATCTFANTLIATHVSTKDDSGATTTGTALNVDQAHGVLANDSGTGLSVASSTQPKHGTVTVNADGSYTYTPNSGFSGTDTFTYTAQDSSGQTATGNVTITVTPVGQDDIGTTKANTTLTVDKAHGVLSNDAGSGLSVTGHTDPSHGTLTINPDGSYTYKPTAGYSGPDSFTYTASDGTNPSYTQKVSLTVTPNAAADTATATAGQTLAVPAKGVLTNDGGSQLVVTGNTQPANGKATVNADGSFTYKPNDGFSGTDTFTYTVADQNGTGTTDTATVTVTVNPKATPDTVTADAGTDTTVGTGSGLLSNDLGTSLQVTGVTQPAKAGTITVNPDGSYTFSPAAGFSGTDTFTYTVTDQGGKGTSSTVTDTIVVHPTAVADTATTRVNVPVAIASASNDLGDTVSVTSAGTSGGATAQGGTVAIAKDGTIEYTPATGFSGTDTFPYTITDANGLTGTGTDTVHVTPVGLADTANTDANTPITLSSDDLTKNDSGTGLHVVSATTPTNGGQVQVDTDGNVTYTPATDFSGTDRFTYIAQDQAGQSTSSVTVTVIVGPTAEPDKNAVAAGSTVAVTDPDQGLLSNDAGTGLHAALDAQAINGTATVNDDGTYSYTPKTGFSGTDTFTYTATDGDGNKSTGLVTITVTPTAVSDDLTGTYGQPLTIVPTDLTGNDQGRGKTVATVDPTSTAGGTITKNQDGSYTYTAPDGFSGDDTFTYTITDRDGNASQPATVTVTIAPVAGTPTGTTTANTALDVPEDQGLLSGAKGTGPFHVTGTPTADNGTVTNVDDSTGTFTYTPDDGFSGTDTVTATITDKAGNPATVTVTITVKPSAGDDKASTTVGQPVDVPVTKNDHGTTLTVTAVGTTTTTGTPITGGTAPQHGTATATSTGTGSGPTTITYTPNAGWSGKDTFTYQVTDASSQVAQATVTVTVVPVAVNDTEQTASNTALTLNGAGSSPSLVANDRGAQLTVIGVGTTAATATGTSAATAKGGTVSVTDGVVTYTPKHGFSGTDTFGYTVTDGTDQTTTATVTVLVGDAAVPYTGATKANEPHKVSASDGVLSGDSGSGLTAKLAKKPAHGTVVLNPDGSYTYTPNPNYSGTDTFTYTATDADGNVATGIVTITVAPTATNDALTTTAGKAVTMKSPGVVGNDHGTGLTVTGTVAQPKHGIATIAADGTLVYTPAKGFSGTDTVEYTAVDASGQTTNAVVTITVGIAAADDHGSTIAGEKLTVAAAKGLLANDDGTQLTVTGVAAKPKHGTVTVASDGSYVYTPAAGFVGTDSFTYTVRDASGRTTTAVATITVVAHAVATNDSRTAGVGTTVTLNPLTNDTPTGGATFVVSTLHLIDPVTHHQVTKVSLVGTGTWTVNGTNVVFDPDGDYAGVVSNGYQVLDTAGQLVAATIKITYPVGLAAAGLAFTGSRGVTEGVLVGLAMLLAGLAIGLRRRTAAPQYGPMRSGGSARVADVASTDEAAGSEGTGSARRSRRDGDAPRHRG
jgi:large repetitive protein